MSSTEIGVAVACGAAVARRVALASNVGTCTTATEIVVLLAVVNCAATQPRSCSVGNAICHHVPSELFPLSGADSPCCNLPTIEKFVPGPERTLTFCVAVTVSGTRVEVRVGRTCVAEGSGLGDEVGWRVDSIVRVGRVVGAEVGVGVGDSLGAWQPTNKNEQAKITPNANKRIFIDDSS